MTVEELLRPRAILTNKYPNCPFAEGAILDHWLEETYILHDPYFSVDNPLKYPANFRKLEWWEYRKLEDMPKYVKRLWDGEIVKVDKWFLVGDDMRWHTQHPFVTMSAETCIPSTEQEYNHYQSQRK